MRAAPAQSSAEVLNRLSSLQFHDSVQSAEESEVIPEHSVVAKGQEDLVARLTDSIVQERKLRHIGTRVPGMSAVQTLMGLCQDLMFPGFFSKRGMTEGNLSWHVRELVARIHIQLEEQVRAVLRYANDVDESLADRAKCGFCDNRAREVTSAFMERLPEIRRLLAGDVQAAFDGDPAACHTDEVIFCYPGVYAIFAHRIAHALYNLDVPLLPRMIHENSHSKCGVDIHPGASVGERFFIDHGAGVIVGQTSIIGDDVRLYQGVTIGATSFKLDTSGQLQRTGRAKRHPTLGNRVTVYSHATILGGETTVGDDCIVAGGVWLNESVPPAQFVVTGSKPTVKLLEIKHPVVPKREGEGDKALAYSQSYIQAGAGI